MGSNRRALRQVLRWAVSIALLGFALYLLDWTSLVASAQRLTLGTLVLAVLLACVPMLASLARWYLLAGGAGGWFLCSARYLYANLVSAASPGSVGGDIYRFFAFRDTARDSISLVAILLRERLFGLISMLVGLLIGATITQYVEVRAQQPLTLALAFAAAAGLAALTLLPRIARYAPESWRDGLRTALAVKPSRKDAALLGWSLAALLLWTLAVQFIATRLGLWTPWPVLLVIVTCVELARFVPVTIQGIGVREGAFATLSGAFGYPLEAAFVVGAVAYAALSLSLVVTGALGALMLARRDPRS